MDFQNNKDEIKMLLSLVKDGNQQAFVSLLSRYKPLIDSAVAKFSSDDAYSLYREDLRQEASVVFYNAILAYDIEQNEVEFGLFAKICIQNALVSVLRKLQRRGAEPIEELSELLFCAECDEPSSKLLEEERLKSIYSVIRKNLSDFEYSVWQMYVSGKGAAQIAQDLDTDIKSVTNAIYRIRKKLRGLLS